MLFNQGTEKSPIHRRIDRELKDLRIFANASSLIDDFRGCWDFLLSKLADTAEGDVVWTGVKRPNDESGLFLDCEGQDDMLTESEVDILLAYTNLVHELTEDSVDNLFDVSPAWRYLASCDQIVIFDEGRRVPRGSLWTPNRSNRSAVILRTLEGPDVVRVTITDASIAIEAGDSWTGLETAELASGNSIDFATAVLNSVWMTPIESSNQRY